MNLYFIHGLGCPALCETGLAIDRVLEEESVKLSYAAEGLWADNFARLLAQSEDADHNSLFIGESMGGFFAAQLSAHYHARSYLLNPVVHPAWQLRQFIGPFTAGGRAVTITAENVRSYIQAPDQRSPLNKGRVGLMLSPADTLIEPLCSEAFYQGHTAFVDMVDDGHGIGNAASFAIIAQRVRDWKTENGFAYCLRRAGVVTDVMGTVF